MFLLLNTSQTFTVFRLKQITLILFEPEATMILLPVLPVLPHAPSPPSPPIMLLLASLFSLTTLKHLFLKRGGAQLKIERENKAAAPQRGEDDGRWGRTMDGGGRERGEGGLQMWGHVVSITSGLHRKWNTQVRSRQVSQTRFIFCDRKRTEERGQDRFWFWFWFYFYFSSVWQKQQKHSNTSCHSKNASSFTVC